MNPFDLHGFFFLQFYLVVGVITLLGLYLWIRYQETANGRFSQRMTDPYLIAHLRAGGSEALRVATVALIDRGLLVAQDDTLATRNHDAVDLVQRPIEKAVLKRFLLPGKAFDIFKDAAAMVSCNAYEKVLADQGLIANGNTYVNRFLPAMAAIVLLVAISVIKVNIALSQGRHNVGFLILLTVMFCFIALGIWRRRRTARGDAMLTDLRSLFARLKSRAGSLRTGGETNEAALLAAVFGLSALPTLAFPFMRKLYPAKSTSGSGCSASCGSSCGGGCGGGGCGG